MWKDCFDKKLSVGNDVIIAISDCLYSGIITEMSNEYCRLLYNNWVDGKEEEFGVFFHTSNHEDNKLKNVYKI